MQRKWWCGLGLLLSVASTAGVSGSQFGDFTYTNDGSAVTIIRYTGPGGDVTVPESIGGLPVRTIGGGAFDGGWGSTNLTRVRIPPNPHVRIVDCGLDALRRRKVVMGAWAMANLRPNAASWVV